MSTHPAGRHPTHHDVPDGTHQRTGSTAADLPVRRLLNVSTAHLPEHLGTPGGLDTVAGVVAHATATGWLLWVPDDPDESSRSSAEPIPGVVLTIMRYARIANCDHVLFEVDADRIDGLPVWDW